MAYRKIFLFILISVTSIFLKAQNWQTVYSDRVQYFDSGVTAIKIIDKQIDTNGDSIFYNYPALYIDTLNYWVDDSGTDSVSWLGKKTIIKPNGENCFVNGLNDKMIIKTNAANNESWEFLRNSNTLITAKVDSVSFGIYNGIRDSVKHISLSVVANSSIHQNMVKGLHKKQIWLSKHNGFLRVPILEYIVNAGWNQYYHSVKPIYNQTKINIFTNKNMFDFEVGDIIQSEEYSNYLYTGNSVYNGYSKRWLIDTYINKNYDSIGDSVQYEIRRRHFFLIDRKNPDTTYIRNDTTFLISKTYYDLSKQAFGVMPLSVGRFIKVTGTASLYTGYKCATEFSIQSNGNCFLPVIKQNEINTFEQSLNLSYTAKKGLYYMYQDGSNGAFPPNPYTTRNSIIYAKNSCGELGKDVTLSINNIKKNTNQITVYPNPANNIILIETNSIKSIELIDLQGKTILSKKSCNKGVELLNISRLEEGIYIIKVISESSISSQKIVIKH